MNERGSKREHARDTFDPMFFRLERADASGVYNTLDVPVSRVDGQPNHLKKQKRPTHLPLIYYEFCRFAQPSWPRCCPCPPPCLDCLGHRSIQLITPRVCQFTHLPHFRSSTARCRIPSLGLTPFARWTRNIGTCTLTDGRLTKLLRAEPMPIGSLTFL